MARINAISEGQPLTYELINQIIAEINDIRRLPDSFGQNLQIYGPALGKTEKDTVYISTGTAGIDVRANQTVVEKDINYEKNVKFDKKNVIVTASVVDTKTGKAGGGTQMANLTIIRITETGFKVRLQVLKSVNKNVTITVHYIAVGAGPRVG